MKRMILACCVATALLLSGCATDSSSESGNNNTTNRTFNHTVIMAQKPTGSVQHSRTVTPEEHPMTTEHTFIDEPHVTESAHAAVGGK